MATISADTTRRPDAGLHARRPLRRVWPARAFATLGAAVALGALAVAVPAPSHAVPGDVSLDQAERDRQLLRDRNAEAAARLDAGKASSEDLIAALTTLDQQVLAETARSTEIDRAYQDAERRFNEVQGQLDENQQAVDRIQNDLRQQAVRRYLAPEEDDSSIRLLKADSIDEAQQRKVLGDAVAGSSRDLIEQLRGARGRLDGLRQQASEAKTEADGRKAEQATLFTRLLAERDAQTRLRTEWNRRVSALTAVEERFEPPSAPLASPPSSGGGSAPAPQSPNGRFIWPVSGKMGDRYGGARNHGGVDILAPVGTPIWAAQSGRVTRADRSGAYNGGYGNLVVIQHANGLETRYAHQSTVRASVGQSVTQGQVIGNVGMTGSTSGPHLHFEVYLNGARQNPSNYLP